MGLFNKKKNKEEIKEPEVILENWSPVCNMQAFVEKNPTSYYLYLWINPSSQEPEIRTCWICNRVAAPEGLDKQAMGNGMAPAMPAEYVAHETEGMELEPESLSFVWFEEGDAVALLCDGEVICVIPGWSGYNGFCGYSKYAKGTGSYAWELDSAMEVLTKRVDKCKGFWDYFEGNYWPEVQKMHMDALEQFFGKYEKYFSIDGGNFPPKALVTGNTEETAYAITAGVSLIPMPKVEQYFEEDSDNNRRIELGLATTIQHKPLCEHMGGAISSISTMPWRELTFLAHGHTVPYHNIAGFAAILFLNPKEVPELEIPCYARCMGDEINLLWLVPITEEEYKFVMEHGIAELLGKVQDKSRLHVFDGRSKFIER